MNDSEQLTDEDTSLRSLFWQTVVFTIVVVAAVIVLGYFFRDFVTEFANVLIDNFGLPGLLFGIVISDAFTFPIPPDTYLLITVATGRDVASMLFVCCVGSIGAGTIAYHVGPLLAKIPFFLKRIDKFRPKGERLYQDYGVWTVVIAALTPIPFSIICWFAGIYEMKFWKFFLATFARVPRLVGYYLLFELGWAN